MKMSHPTRKSSTSSVDSACDAKPLNWQELAYTLADTLAPASWKLRWADL